MAVKMSTYAYDWSQLCRIKYCSAGNQNVMSTMWILEEAAHQSHHELLLGSVITVNTRGYQHVCNIQEQEYQIRLCLKS